MLTLDVVSFEEANLTSVLVNGWKPDSMLFKGVRVLRGRTIRPGDGKVAMLGRVLALNLKKDVGDGIKVSGVPFTVVGVYDSDSLFENGGLVMPIGELQTMMGRDGEVSGFVVSAGSSAGKDVECCLSKAIESKIPGVAAVSAGTSSCRGTTRSGS